MFGRIVDKYSSHISAIHLNLIQSCRWNLSINYLVNSSSIIKKSTLSKFNSAFVNKVNTAISQYRHLQTKTKYTKNKTGAYNSPLLKKQGKAPVTANHNSKIKVPSHTTNLSCSLTTL